MAQAAESVTRDQPLKGVVLCCTSLTPDVRTKLAEVAAQMGATHELDLRADVTHLLAGSTNSPKYRYVAKDRPDIAVLQPEWVEAVRKAWMEGVDDAKVEALEKEYALPPFFGLRISVTGFDDIEQRTHIEKTVALKGGTYSGDMTRANTHLIVADVSMQSAKYTHARQWNIHTVSYKWFEDSLERGMAVDESLYAPELPLDQQGRGAFRKGISRDRTVLGKRLRGGEAAQQRPGEQVGRRKLRKAASMRLEGHSQDLWQGLAAPEMQVETSEINAWDDVQGQTATSAEERGPPPDAQVSDRTRPADESSVISSRSEGLFGGYFILIHGFDSARARTINKFLVPNGAVVVNSVNDLEAASEHDDFRSRCLLVPHDSTASDYPDVPLGTLLVTEWWVERCVSNKRMVDPKEDALSQPIPRIQECSPLTVSTTGFPSVDVRQIAQAVAIMGATYHEKLLPATSVMICGPATARVEKTYYAKKHNIPVVSSRWLFATLKSKQRERFEGYLQDLQPTDPSDIAGGSSKSDVTQNDTSLQMSDKHKSKRLSNTRNRRTAPALTLKPSETIQSRRPGPFILEDDIPDNQASIAAAAPEKSIVMSSKNSRPLAEISPNASLRGSADRIRTGNPIANAELKNREGPAEIAAEMDRIPTPNHECVHLPDTRAQQVLNLAELLQSRAASRTEPVELQKRKKRPLGRNMSWVSNPSVSSKSERASPEREAPDPLVPELKSAADGFHLARNESTESAPPSTQLGYDMEGMDDALRRQLSKKLGCVVSELDGSLGRRVASLGTVKDSEIVAMKEAKANRRTRHRI